MAKILISSDHHHDPWPQFAKPLSGGLQSRLLEGLQAELAVEKRALELGCTHHVRVGDLFHKKNAVDAVCYAEVANLLANSQLRQWILKGNHDLAGGGARHSLETLRHISHNAITVIDTPAVFQVDDARLHFLPHMDDLAQLRACAPNLAKEVQPGRMNLLFGHVAINGAKNGSEFRLASTIDLGDLLAPAYDQVWLGHYHEPQVLAPNAQYVGSFLQRSFSDVGACRRAIVLDTTTGAITEIPVPGPRFVNVAVATRAQLGDDLDGTGFSDAYVKLSCFDPAITKKELEEAIGPCLGLVPKYERPEENRDVAAPTPAAERRDASWSDHLAAWVDRSATILDRTALLAVGEHLIREGAGMR
jgi:hypothetical protein